MVEYFALTDFITVIKIPEGVVTTERRKEESHFYVI